MKAITRLKEYIDYKGFTNSSFEKSIDISNGYIGTQIRRNADLGETILNKILDYCLDLNPEWLLTGHGVMLKTKSEENVTVLNGNNNGNKNSNKPKVKKMLPFAESEEGIPLIPIDAMAGYGEGDITVMAYEAGRYVVPEFTELHVEFMIRVKGSSMYPKYNSGDIVACKKLPLQDLFFQWNNVYVLDTTQGALIKRIKKGSDKNHILLVSDNSSYDPFELPITQIRAVSLVLGVIRLE